MMRTYDIPYVKNAPQNVLPEPPIGSLDLRTIVRKYLCNKADMKVSNCMKCSARCAYGQRAIDLTTGNASTEEFVNPKDLLNNPTIMEKIRMSKAKEQETPKTETIRVYKDGRKYVKNWFEKASAAENPIKWVMDTYGISEKQAKTKLWNWKTKHRKETNSMLVDIVNNQSAEPKSAEQKPVEPEPVKTKPAEPETKQTEVRQPEAPEKKPEPSGTSALEEKLAYFMRLQDEYKKKIMEYQKLYDAAKRDGDVLCSAMDIMNR